MSQNSFKFQKRFFKDVSHCTDGEKISICNLIAYPLPPSKELIKDVFSPDENTIVELLITETGFIVGCYIAVMIVPYKVYYLKRFAINPQLKARIYGREIIHRIEDKGLSVYNENFMGIVATSSCDKYKKNKENNLYKNKILFNTGGKLVAICAGVKNQILHLIYIPCNGGRDYDEIQEVFANLHF